MHRATKVLAGLKPSQAGPAGGNVHYNDRATTAAIDAAASAVRHEAGSAAFLQQRYMETLRPVSLTLGYCYEHRPLCWRP